MTASTTTVPPRSAGRTPRQRAVRALVVVVLAYAAWRVLERIVGDVDWQAVGRAFGRVDAAALVVLVAALLVRQGLNAVPLARYVPDLSWRRSVQSDLAANVVATFSPPPTDVVVRVRMFQSWRVDPVLGMTGVSLNTATFYAVRFVTPALGLLLLGVHEAQVRQWVVAGACAVVSVVMLGALLLLLRSEALAARLGRVAARVVRPVRRSVDPSAWADAAIDLRRRAESSLRSGLAWSMLALVGMVLADAGVLVVALRAVGVPASDLPVLDVLAAFLLAYPLTLLPLFGLGALDALLAGAFVAVAGSAAEPDVVAALVVWRAVTILGTLTLGVGAVGTWRLGVRRTPTATP